MRRAVAAAAGSGDSGLMVTGIMVKSKKKISKTFFSNSYSK